MNNKNLSSFELGHVESKARFHLAFRSAVPALQSDGYVLLPGLTDWFDEINPFNHAQAWQAFRDERTASFIRAHAAQQSEFFLNDFGEIDAAPQQTVSFAEKRGKTHLTVREGVERLAGEPLLPSMVQKYLSVCGRFLRSVRTYFNEILPPSSLKTSVSMRVFHYQSDDPFVEWPGSTGVTEAMRPHVDGSVCTLIIAQSDGLLEFERRGHWQPAIRDRLQPFALLIPGRAALHDLGVQPTPHKVLQGLSSRISITAFLTPALGGKREDAERILANWRLADCYQESDNPFMLDFASSTALV